MRLLFNIVVFLGGSMEKLKSFKILWNYLKEDKVKLFLYLFLVIITYIPALL